MISPILETLYTFKARLLQTPLLLGWLLIGPLTAPFNDGWSGFTFGLINIFLIGTYAIFIRWMTPDAPPPAKVKRPRLELTLALILFGMFMVVQLFDFDVWTIEPWHSWIRGLFIGVNRSVAGISAIPQWALQDVYLAVSSTIEQLIPTLLVFLLLRYCHKDMGFAHPHWKLTTVLMGVTAIFGLFTGVLIRAPLVEVLGLYLVAS